MKIQCICEECFEVNAEQVCPFMIWSYLPVQSYLSLSSALSPPNPVLKPKYCLISLASGILSLSPKPSQNLTGPHSLFRFQFILYFLNVHKLDLGISSLSFIYHRGTCLFLCLSPLLAGFCKYQTWYYVRDTSTIFQIENYKSKI